MRGLEKGERRRFFEMVLNSWTKNGTIYQSNMYLKRYTVYYTLILERILHKGVFPV